MHSLENPASRYGFTARARQGAPCRASPNRNGLAREAALLKAALMLGRRISYADCLGSLHYRASRRTEYSIHLDIGGAYDLCPGVELTPDPLRKIVRRAGDRR